nr:5' AMP activated protein kinase subunit gamma [Hymenolepis microstoma]
MRRNVKFKTPSCSSDFARSCPDRDSMNCFGLMSELMSAVDILSARQNQWNSSNDAKSTIQVLEAAQSSTLLFVRKSVDEPDDEAGKPKDLRYFDEDSACSMFFRHSTCYDVLPESGKLLVLDSTLPIRRAMQALIDHSLSAAPVWCNRLQCYTQLLTTDLCLRLLAQAFPLDASSSSPSSTIGNDEDVSVRKRNSDPNVSMSYWEDKTIDSVLKTFFNWAHAECPQQAVPELNTYTGSSCIGIKYGSGNLLGLLNSDRLLAYLRVRMRNLPTPSALKASVSSLSGIRWEQRGWQTADSTCLHDGESDPPPGENRRSTPQRILSSSGDSFYLQPKTTCLEALHIITRAWNEAGLSCLPVATENGTGFQGMLTKHDILGTIFAGPLDVALNASIGTILSVRPRPTGFTNQAMCFTSECLVAVLDRMFRQKASCLVVFDKPGSGASWNGQGALGKAIGVITAADLLQAIVIDAPTPPPSASYAEIPEDAVFSKTPSQVKGRYPTRSGGGGNKRHSLPPEMANSLPGAQILSPFSNHQHGLTKIFHRTKRNSESEVSPLEGPFATAANSNTAGSNGQSHRPHSHQPGKTNTTPSNQHNGDDGTLFEMDECV